MHSQSFRPYRVRDGELLKFSSDPDREYLNVGATEEFLQGDYTHIEHSGRVHYAIVQDQFVFCGEPVGSST